MDIDALDDDKFKETFTNAALAAHNVKEEVHDVIDALVRAQRSLNLSEDSVGQGLKEFLQSGLHPTRFLQAGGEPSGAETPGNGPAKGGRRASAKWKGIKSLVDLDVRSGGQHHHDVKSNSAIGGAFVSTGGYREALDSKHHVVHAGHPKVGKSIPQRLQQRRSSLT